MNVQQYYYDNFIDAKNEFTGGGGGDLNFYNFNTSNATSNIFINNNLSFNRLDNYVYSSNDTLNNTTHLYLINSNTYGEIRFGTLLTKVNPTRDHDVRINKFGKLEVYHPYDITNPTVLEGWKDVENELSGLIFGLQVNGLEMIAVQGQIAGIDTAISQINGTLTTLEAYNTATVANLEAIQYGFFNIDEYNEFVMNNFSALTARYSTTINNYATVANSARVGEFIGGVLVPAGIGAVIGGIYNYLDYTNLHNIYSNVLSSNPNLTEQERKDIQNPSSNLIRNTYLSFNSNFCNMSLEQGFINSNITVSQLVPTLKSNKVLLGNITTPNASYQMEGTGDINFNEYYRNSTSLTSLLNEKQNNMSATQPIFITTANIGLNYDSSLTKVGNNLSVVKTATAPLNWTGNNIALSYDNTLLNNAGSLGVSIGAESKWSFSGGNIYNKAMTNVGIGTDTSLTYKLNVIGDTYVSGNTNIGISKLSFISAYSGQSAYALASGTDEYYIEFNSGGGTLVLNEPCSCDILCVGAGGNGGTGASSGGGGSGEVIYYPNFPLRAGQINIQVGSSSTNPTNRISRLYPNLGNEIMRAVGGGNGGTSIFYSTSGGTVSALTAISGTNDAYISITAGTTLTLNVSCSADILVIGGGGGGGRWMGGGGGAGGVVYQTNVNLNSGSYSITIGAGGTGSTATNTFSGVAGGDGGDTFIQSGGSDLVINSITYRGKGGGGGGDYASATGNGTGTGNGSAGGSGGGGNAYQSPTTGGAANQGNTYFNGSTNVAGGYAGGTGSSGFSGGGGGAGGVGGGGTGDNIMRGGTGVQISITGTNSWYAGGGGGAKLYAANASNNGIGGLGGSGVGGDGNASEDNSGDYNYIATRHNGTNGTGSGGGGGAYGQNSAPASTGGGTGGSGVVIIRFKNYLSIGLATSGGSGGGAGKSQSGAVAGTKFDEYKSYALAGLNGTSTTGGNGGSGSSIYNTRFTTTITGSSLSVGLGGSGATSSSTPVVKTNYGDGGDGNGGTGAGGIVIIRFKADNSYLQVKAIKDNGNSGLILNANETVSGTTTPYQLRIHPWSDTYTTTGVATRGWTFRTCDGITNNDLLNLFSYFGGRVGIKTKNPASTFDVNGDINCKTFFVNGDEQYGILCQIVNQHSFGEASLVMTAGQGTSYGNLSIVNNPATNISTISTSKNLKISTARVGSYIYMDDATGYIGIGITNPASKLEVSGTTTTNTLSASIIYAGEVQTNIINNGNGNITNNNNLFSSNIYVNNAIDMQNKPINNCSYLYGGCSWTNELKATTNYYHKDDQGRERIYFKNDTTGSPANHFTLFKSGGTTHAFSDKDDVQYCLLERFGLTTYFEVISGGGYDAVSVLDASATGTYVFRKMYVKLNSLTEVHRCFCEDPLYLNYDDFINEFVGRVVVSKGRIKTALKEAEKDWEILEGKDGITIDDSHPVIELSRKKKDKAVVGVITKRNQNNDLSGRLVINSLGETGIWIINTGGNIENGDLITTSDEIGYAERQDDDNIMRNYTIGKCMIDCDFELDNPNYKCEVIDAERDLRRAFLPIFIYSG